MGEISAVIFDVGNVLVHWDPRNLYRQHFDDNDELEYFLSEVATPAWNLEQDRGRRFVDAVAELTIEHPHYASLIELYDSRWPETLGGAINGSVQILEALVEAGVPLFAITNFSAEKWPVFEEKYPFTEHFQEVVISGREKLLKPDPRIYQVALERFGLGADEAFFTDDSLANVEGARALGIRSHHFRAAAPLAAELQALGLL